MSSYLTRTREGNAKKERTEKTHTNTPGPERANPEKAREKKSGGRRKRTKTSGRGEGTEAPEPTYQSVTNACLGTRKPQTYLRRETTNQMK